MLLFWLIFVATILILATFALVALPIWRRRHQESRLTKARATFHQRREWLEARFLKLASASGTPRGLSWADCEFDDRVAFAREKTSGCLRALVAVSIKFEAIEGGGMEDVEAVGNYKAATVVFRFDDKEWHAEGRPYFNLSPAQTIERFQNELELAE